MRKLGWRPLALAALALAWGLALSAFFWLPALLETNAVQIADVTQGYFFYGNHFRAADLVQPSLFFSLDTSAGAPTPFSMSLAQALATAGGLLAMIVAAVRTRRWTATDTSLLLGLAIATFMMTPASAWLWANLPLLRFSQFPWRFLSIQALFASLIIARLVPEPRVDNAGSMLRWALSIGLGLALAVTTLGRLRPEFIPVADTDVTAQRLALMEYFSGNIGSTIGYEYLPRAVSARPFTSGSLLDRPPQLLALSGQATGIQLSTNGSEQEWTIDAGDVPATVALPTHYWPGWTAYVDGYRTATGPAAGLGWISFSVPAGLHTVRLRLEQTALRLGAEALAVLTLVLPWGYAVFAWTRRRQPVVRSVPVVDAPAPSATRGPGVPIVAGLGLLGLAGAASLILHVAQPPLSTLPLSIDFDQLTYLHRDAIRFDDGTQVASVTYAADHLARGEALMLQSTWQPSAAGTVQISLVPASNLLDQASLVLTTTTAALAAPATITSTLIIPRNIPPGIYFVAVQWSDSQGQPRTALTPAGRPRGLVHLAPVWIDDPGPPPASGEPLARFGPSIELSSASTGLAEPGVLQVNLAWHALAQVPANIQIGMRLRDAAGAEWAASDTQLAYGFYPTPLWRPNEVIPDFYRLRLPAGTPPGSYQLDLDLYDAATRASLGALATLPVRLDTVTPRGDRVPHFALSPSLALAEVEIASQFNQGDAPELRAGWLTTSAPGAGWRARWTLIAADGTRTSQVLDLAPGSPTAGWPADAYVLGRVRLGTLPTLAPGLYTLAVQLIDAQDQPAGDELVVAKVEVLGRARSFDLPTVTTHSGAAFGDVIELYGYDLEQTNAELRLTVVWRALTTPGRDYKFFVHLFNTADGFVAAQFDAMPRDFTYPTALWVKDEVVSDTIHLSLAGAAPGQYRLALGWYDSLQPDRRLPVRDSQGQPLPDGQLVLPEPVQVP